ncbi:MAG: cardiolipin synthase [Methanofollis sp.]|uniref:cardiolipin synthase n=1 Tax=Methanofollis sp. TaxID=2052835 RepID=UPI00261FACE2|nr:cardiolipin synthase [Methanofollis sp.]MDD4255719.1 cardiolipin synthase [Methanofollis sp.]
MIDIFYDLFFVPILFLNVLFAVTIVFFERKNPSTTLAWLSILFFLPLLGFVLYLFLGHNYHRERLFKAKAEDDARVQGLIAAQMKSLAEGEIVFRDPRLGAYLSMVLMLMRNNWAFLTADNRVTVYTDGEEKFAALLDAIAGARDFVHLEYYIIRDDALGRRVVGALTEKARQGVEVRLLVDGLGCARLPRDFFDAFVDAGGRLARFFPSVVPYLNPRMNYRNHRKIAVIDGRVGFVGGFNIGDEYLGKDSRFGYWRDTALKIEGYAAAGLQGRFFLDWNFASGPELSYSPRYFPEMAPAGETAIQIVSSGPDARWNQVKEAYLKLINSAKKSVYIQTPYFVPDGSVADALRIAALSGVDVRVMIPCKPDHPFVYWASYSFIGELLEAGVRAYTYDRGFIHAKTIVVDGIAASVGSANWDERSFRLNFETNAFVYDPAVAGRLHEIFLADIRDCSELTPAVYAARGRVIKVKESVSRLFSPLL